MNEKSTKFTALDNYLYAKFTTESHMLCGKRKRLVHMCIYNTGENPACSFKGYEHSLK